jgi:hypothetical protein
MNFNLSLTDRIALTVAELYGYRRPVKVNVESSGRIYAGSDYCGTVNERRNEILFDRQGFEARTYHLDALNPTVKTTTLRAYPGWVVYEYANGSFVADNLLSVALSPGYDTFGEAVGFAKRDGASA